MNQTPEDVPEDEDQPARAAGLARLTAIAKTALTQQYSILVYLIISFIIGQTLVVYFYYRTAALNHQTQEVQLARDLYREFYAKENGYLRVANAIEGCEKLYKSDGGKFSHLEINQYRAMRAAVDCERGTEPRLWRGRRVRCRRGDRSQRPSGASNLRPARGGRAVAEGSGRV